MCNAISHHLLMLIDDRIQCEKCWTQWDLEGRELVPAGFPSWVAWREECMSRPNGPALAPELQCTGKITLTPRQIARVLVEELINKNQLRDQAEIRALRSEAAQNTDVFIEQVLGRNQP